MQESMIYVSSPSLEQLIEKQTALNRRINDSLHSNLHKFASCDNQFDISGYFPMQ